MTADRTAAIEAERACRRYRAAAEAAALRARGVLANGARGGVARLALAALDAAAACAIRAEWAGRIVWAENGPLADVREVEALARKWAEHAAEHAEAAERAASGVIGLDVEHARALAAFLERVDAERDGIPAPAQDAAEALCAALAEVA